MGLAGDPTAPEWGIIYWGGGGQTQPPPPLFFFHMATPCSQRLVPCNQRGPIHLVSLKEQFRALPRGCNESPLLKHMFIYLFIFKNADPVVFIAPWRTPPPPSIIAVMSPPGKSTCDLLVIYSHSNIHLNSLFLSCFVVFNYSCLHIRLTLMVGGRGWCFTWVGIVRTGNRSAVLDS